MKLIADFENIRAKHSYEIQVSKTEYVTVDADTRSQAAAIAKKNGYNVCSVNMVG